MHMDALLHVVNNAVEKYTHHTRVLAFRSLNLGIQLVSILTVTGGKINANLSTEGESLDGTEVKQDATTTTDCDR